MVSLTRDVRALFIGSHLGRPRKVSSFATFGLSPTKRSNRPFSCSEIKILRYLTDSRYAGTIHPNTYIVHLDRSDINECVFVTRLSRRNIRNGHSKEPSSLFTLELEILSLEMSRLGIFFDCFHRHAFSVVFVEQVEDALGVGGGDCALLCEVSLNHHRIRVLYYQPILIQRLGC